MVEFAAFEFDLNQLVSKESKQTKRQAFESLKRQGVVIPEYQNRPTLPRGYEYIWQWFADLAMVCDQITFAELKAWQDLRGWRLKGHEVDAIMALERTRRQA